MSNDYFFKVAIQSVSGERYLDGCAPGDKKPSLTDRNPNGDVYLNWEIKPVGDNIYAFRSLSSNRYLDGRAPGDTKPTLTDRNPNGDAFLNWRIIPVDYKLTATFTDFQYQSQDIVDEVLNQATVHSLIDKHVLTVPESAVGSSVQRTFTKSVENSFMWNINEKIGISAAIEFSAGIPLLFKAEFNVSASFEFSSTQEWSTTETETYSCTATLLPNEPGTYEMSGIVDIGENVQLPFNATAVFQAKQEHNGIWVTLNSACILRILKFEKIEATVTNEKNNSVEAAVSGNMTGTYGLKTYTSIVKLS
jgi:hypothetical protein